MLEFAIVVLVLIVFFISLFVFLYFFFNQKDKYFRKNLHIGDKCVFYSNENEHVKCEVISMKDDMVEIKGEDGKIYNKNIEDIVSI
jgi:hypothetical protein